MRSKLAVGALFSLCAWAVVLPARASVAWTGPGWYLEDADQTIDNILVSGPYKSKVECDADRPPDSDDDQYLCLFEQTDPTVTTPPRRP